MSKQEIISQLEKARRQFKSATDNKYPRDEIKFAKNKVKKLEKQLADIEETEKKAPKGKVKKPAAKKKSKPEKTSYKFKDPVMEKEPADFDECKDLLDKARKRMKSSREWREKRQREGKPIQKTVAEVVGTAAEVVGQKVEQLDEKKN